MRILVIPDIQIKPGHALSFLTNIGRYIVHKKPDVIVQIGDFADMESLSFYDKGKKSFEGRRYKLDIEAAHKGMEALLGPLNDYNKRKGQSKKKKYLPRKILTLGNHENRITRAVECEPILEGTIGIEDLKYKEYGWEVYDFLEVAEVEGIMFSHYFPRGPNGKISQTYRGAPSARAQAQREMKSCVSGHLQGLDFHVHETGERRIYSIIAGSCYEHEEAYLSPQGTKYWRGVIMLNEVKDGEFDPCFISLNFLRIRYGQIRR